MDIWLYMEKLRKKQISISIPIFLPETFPDFEVLFINYLLMMLITPNLVLQRLATQIRFLTQQPQHAIIT
jgi:hypothetical protein